MCCALNLSFSRIHKRNDKIKFHYNFRFYLVLFAFSAICDVIYCADPLVVVRRLHSHWPRKCIHQKQRQRRASICRVKHNLSNWKMFSSTETIEFIACRAPPQLLLRRHFGAARARDEQSISYEIIITPSRSRPNHEVALSTSSIRIFFRFHFEYWTLIVLRLRMQKKIRW